MKKIMRLLIISCFILFIMSGIAVLTTKAEKAKTNKALIYVNDIEISNENMTVIDDNTILIPLRAVLESLGSEVTWNANTGNIYFTYADIEYVCKFEVLNPHFPENKSILICKAENINSFKTNDYIKLHPMGAAGFYHMLNDRTYLYEGTGKRLFEALGCSVEIDSDTHTVKISNRLDK